MMKTIIAIARTSRIAPTAIGMIGRSLVRLTLTGGRLPALPLPERTPVCCLLAMNHVEYRLNLSGLDPDAPEAADRPWPEPIGRRSLLREYELLYILRADLDDEKVQDSVKRVNTIIERSGGRPDHTNLWGKRKLAYEVKHQKEGSYVLQDFQIGPDRVPELESALKISEDVLRHLIV